VILFLPKNSLIFADFEWNTDGINWIGGLTAWRDFSATNPTHIKFHQSLPTYLSIFFDFSMHFVKNAPTFVYRKWITALFRPIIVQLPN